MRLKAYNTRHKRRKTDSPETWEKENWEKTIESLAISLCPTQEWQAYEKKLQHLAWQANKQQNSARVSVFPIWRKYRQQALRVATLYRTVPVLRHLPLPVANFLGEILF